MYRIQRRVLSQNFFYSRKFVRWLIRKSFIHGTDTVLDIGAGKGIITESLLKIATKVIAIEIDSDLCIKFNGKFKDESRVELLNIDFLQYSLPEYPYKVFANIPFCIEGEIIRKLLNAKNPPDDAYLVLREDLAIRLGGVYRESKFSILYKPWFTFSINHSFRRTDFEPMARMETVLLRFTKKMSPLVPLKEQTTFRSFIEMGFKDGKSIKQNLNCILTSTQLGRLASINGFSPQDKPSYLNLKQWINIYSFIRKYIVKQPKA